MKSDIVLATGAFLSKALFGGGGQALRVAKDRSPSLQADGGTSPLFDVTLEALLPSPVWGEVKLKPSDGVLHFGITGCTGSGKSIKIRRLMASVLSGMSPSDDRRAIVYDAKRDVFPFLDALGLAPLVINLNPFDKRGVAWDIAADITSGGEAEQFASIIIPANPQEHNPFFTDAARILLHCAITALQKRLPGAWSLRDLILCMCSEERLRALLSVSPQEQEVAENFFRAKEFSSVMSTIETKLRPLRIVAALWDGAPRKVSLTREWLNSGSILLLAHHPSYSHCLEPINRAVFPFLSDSMLAQPPSRTRRSWVFLDEAREAGRLDGLRRLLTQGRDRGVCVVLGFQDIEGMREVYGKEGANELLGECNHKTFLRTDCPETAVWMESHVNKALIRARQVGRDKEGKISTTDSFKIDHTVLAGDFLGIPVTSIENGLRGFHISSRIPKPYWTAVSLQEALAFQPLPNPGVLGEDPRPKSAQELRPWTEQDSARLGLVSQVSGTEVQPVVALPLEGSNHSTRESSPVAPSGILGENPDERASSSRSTPLWAVRGRRGRDVPGAGVP